MANKRPSISTGNPDIAGWKQPLAVFWTVSLLSYLSANFLSPILPFFLGTLGLDDPAQVNLWTSRLSTAILLPSILSVPFWGIHHLLVIRFLAGFFGAGIIPTLSAMVIHHVEMKDRGVTLAMISSLCGLGSAASVYFGGAIVNRIGFAALFLALAGIFAAVTLTGRLLLKKETGSSLKANR